MNEQELPDVDVATMSQLVSAAKAGDDAAHNEICKQVQTRLNRMANQQLDAHLRRKLNPSDIVQATMARMVQGFEDFRGSTSAEFYGWLNTILRNEVNNNRRSLYRDRRDIRRETEPPKDGPIDWQGQQETPDSEVYRGEKLAKFRQVIQRLPEDYAQVIELRSIQELSFKEVAVEMDRSVDAVSKLWARALVKLQQELAKIDDSLS